MRTTCILTISALAAALGLSAQEDDKPGHPPIPPPPAVHVLDTAEGLAPRMSPRDYITMGKAGDVVIGAEFDRHAVPARELTLNTEDFVVVEVGLYGPPGAKLNISLDDFSLRINGKKNVLHSQPYGRVLGSIKDPQWAPPDQAKEKSKTSLGTGGGQDAGSPPPVFHPPFELQRAWNVHTQKATLPLGERPLPQAGLLFFQYRGKADNLDSVDLYYDGAAGRVTIPLRP
jgi:hypothetical protein